MKKEELKEILDKHLKWLRDEKGGERANLISADLRGADLIDADLTNADLRGADLIDADLTNADLRGADLIDADLTNANLRAADLRGANLTNANLRGADLIDADLTNADLRGADLRGANLRGADLTNANLRAADLIGADLRGVYLIGADLTNANLRGADLRGANLINADLRGAYLIDVNEADKMQDILISHTSICPEGAIIGWKKCRNNVIVKLEIPAEAKRSNSTGRKCRAEYAKVLEVIGAEIGISRHDDKTEYRAGEIIKPDSWDDNRWDECSNGIHFFITRLEAENY